MRLAKIAILLGEFGLIHCEAEEGKILTSPEVRAAHPAVLPCLMSWTNNE